jgi:3-phenylpropionate/cinnamic acid dioxygenase small subunit
MSGEVSLASVTAFLTDEARLLDDQNWQEWSELFTEDGIYWVPAGYQQVEPRRHVSLIYEDKLLRAVRIARLLDANAISLQPHPRGWRQITNVRVDAAQDGSSDVIATAKLLAVEYRHATQPFYATTTHRLTVVDGKFQIKLKRVDLINCDAPLGDINLYL